MFKLYILKFYSFYILTSRDRKTQPRFQSTTTRSSSLSLSLYKQINQFISIIITTCAPRVSSLASQYVCWQIRTKYVYRRARELLMLRMRHTRSLVIIQKEKKKSVYYFRIRVFGAGCFVCVSVVWLGGFSLVVNKSPFAMPFDWRTLFIQDFIHY